MILVITNSNENLFNCLIDNYNVFMYNLIEIKKKMKKVLFTLAIIAFASCSSNETSTSSANTLNCKDSACCDSTSVDSLVKSVEAHSDSLLTEVKK